MGEMKEEDIPKNYDREMKNESETHRLTRRNFEEVKGEQDQVIDNAAIFYLMAKLLRICKK